MPGFAIPKFFKDQNLNDFKNQMDVNYFGIIKCLKMCMSINHDSFTFIVAGSIAGLFHFPGYSSYAPTKNALYTFVKCAGPELEIKNVNLKMILCPTMKTEGLSKENKIKAKFTKEIEDSKTYYSPKKLVKEIIGNINDRRIITTDWFGYFVVIRNDCEYIKDYLFLGVAILVIEISK